MADILGEKQQAKITAQHKKVVSTVFFFISLSRNGSSISHKYSIFIQQLNLFHFGKIFQNREFY